MKVTSYRSKGSGKVGSSVFVINHGVMIEREYNGSVSNPSTPAQVAQRSRFKLASQVSAAMEDVIVIPRKGMKSPRNLFVKRNMSYFYGDAEGAQVSYENLQLTIGNQGIPGIVAERDGEGGGGSTLTLSLQGSANKSVTHVVYNVFKKTDEDMLQLMNSVVVEGSADNPAFVQDIDNILGTLVIYAYGFKGRNANAEAKYGNYQVNTGEDVARLFANRVLELSDYRFTDTRGTTLRQSDSQSVTPPASSALLYLTKRGQGTLSVKVNDSVVAYTEGEPVVVGLGTTVKITATPATGWLFNAWFENGNQTPLSNVNEYTYTAVQMRDIVASFVEDGGLE